MRLEPVLTGVNGLRSVSTRRTVFCDLHRPVETSSSHKTCSQFVQKLNGWNQSPMVSGGSLNVWATSLLVPPEKSVVSVACCIVFVVVGNYVTYANVNRLPSIRQCLKLW